MSEPYQPTTGDGRLKMDNQSEKALNRMLLLEMNVEMVADLMPAIIYLVVLMLIGSVGNFLVIYIIGWKLKASAQNSLFMWLGVFDIITCLIGMPSEIADLSQYYLYENVAACKIMRFLLSITAISSANLLVIIAIDRFRRVCRPLHGQMEMGHVRVGVALAALVAFVVAGPALSLYGGRTVATPLPGLSGRDCSVQDKYIGRLYPLLYEMVFGVAFVGYTVVLAVLYVRVWLEIRRHHRYMAQHSIQPAATSSDQFRSTESEEELEADTKLSRVGAASESARSRIWLLLRGVKKKEYQRAAVEDEERAELRGSGAESPGLRKSRAGEAAAELRDCGAGLSCSSSGPDKNGSSRSDRFAEITPMHNYSPPSTSHAERSVENLGKSFRNVGNNSTSVGLTAEVVENCYLNGGGGKLTLNSPVIFFTQAAEITPSEGTERISISTQQKAGDPVAENIGHARTLAGDDPSERLPPLEQTTENCCGDSVPAATTAGKGGEEEEKDATGCVAGKSPREQHSLLTPLYKANTTASETSSAFSSTSNVGGVSGSGDGGGGGGAGAERKLSPLLRGLAASSWDLSMKIRKSLRANKLTMVAMAVTVVFVLSYLPHLCLIILRSMDRVLDDHRLSGAQLVFYNIFLRSYFVNSVANVFVYSAVNPEFRRHCKRLCACLSKNFR